MFLIRRLKISQGYVSRLPCFNFSNEGNPLKDKEQAYEKQYFSSEEAKVLKRLVEKLEKNVPLSKEEKQELKGKDENMLRFLEEKHKLKFPQELFNDILLWKRGEL